MRKCEHIRRIAWDSALPETVINGITFTPLTDTRALAQEAYEMKHCVSSYADLCINGTYRVFAVQDAQHGRSTLGIYLDAGAIGIDQHRGRYNGRLAGLDGASRWKSMAILLPHPNHRFIPTVFYFESFHAYSKNCVILDVSQ